MQIEQLARLLDDPDQANSWFASLRIEDTAKARENLACLASLGLPLDLLAALAQSLEQFLPVCSDPDMALNNLERLFRASRSPLALGGLFERDPTSLQTLIRIFSTSQFLSDQIIGDPESFELLRITDGQPAARQFLIDEIVSEIGALNDETTMLRALRRFKRREILRIAYGDLIREQNIETVSRQISFLADALIEASLQAALKVLTARFGQPLVKSPGQPGATPARFTILALGKLGGTELNYSSDIDLMFLYDGEGNTSGAKSITNREFFDRVGQRMVKLLSEPTDLGAPYRVDMRLRPEGSQGPLVVSLEGAMNYYDVLGRTWERQAFVKARTAAGDRELGEKFLARLGPWIYRNYLNRADITGIRALKRRIERRAQREGGDDTNVKTGHGGIRDIEFVIQFLQLLNGGDLVDIRTGNTLDAIRALESVGCLTLQERSILEENYNFLRKLEHRLQIMFDLQTHSMPTDERELAKLAWRMGFTDQEDLSALDAFKVEYHERTELNRKILDHLLHDAFPDDEEIAPAVDLVLDPDPTADTIDEVLADYGFHDPQNAYDSLMTLSTERVRFLSTRRCRHFLAAISPQLLEVIAQTPDPDSTLVNLSQVSDSLGGKGVLWELFSVNPATLNLYVRMCASSPYLSNILISNPGMIDELMDSLMLDKLPGFEVLEQMMNDLCRGAEDIFPILHSFKNLLHLRVGVLDILGKKDLVARHGALSDVAEVCLHQIARREYRGLISRFGEPRLEDGQPCDLIILAMGKIGGREPNYHSDLDLVFLYEGEGTTHTDGRNKQGSSTSNQHFFGQLGQRIVKAVNELGPYGRLYELDSRLRPTGKNGALAVSLAEFTRYYTSGEGQLWERQALCKARPIFGASETRRKTEEAIYTALTCQSWQPEFAREIRAMRARIEEGATTNNLKRGPGGTVDIEFLVQTLQLKHAAEDRALLAPGTLMALEKLHERGHLSAEDFQHFHSTYEFFRIVEARLRLMNTTARHDLPESRTEVEKLAYLLDYADSATLLKECRQRARETRRRFDKLMAAVG